MGKVAPIVLIKAISDLSVVDDVSAQDRLPQDEVIVSNRSVANVVSIEQSPNLSFELSSLSCKAVDVTPWPSSLKKGGDIITGLSNKYSVFMEPIIPRVVQPVPFVIGALDDDCGQEGFTSKAVEVSIETLSPRKARVGVPQLLHDMKVKKKC
ncbi:hypothetical protein V6N13_018918 [Hibiscus sabdariffa]|uniref:Uncharacterized protein n=1 Tax=Hibiscus sabdariffa TaxID=183260 RepID=A0ABR2EKT0_9ROSI